MYLHGTSLDVIHAAAQRHARVAGVKDIRAPADLVTSLEYADLYFLRRGSRSKQRPRSGAFNHNGHRGGDVQALPHWLMNRGVT
jgi:hypothetical protein